MTNDGYNSVHDTNTVMKLLARVPHLSPPSDRARPKSAVFGPDHMTRTSLLLRKTADARHASPEGPKAVERQGLALASLLLVNNPPSTAPARQAMPDAGVSVRTRASMGRGWMDWTRWRPGRATASGTASVPHNVSRSNKKNHLKGEYSWCTSFCIHVGLATSYLP